jgi:hypothetical protein
VNEHFAFLVEHGFRVDHVETSAWAITVVYLSQTLGIEVTRSVEFGRVEITLLRLVEGQSPEHEVWLTERPLNRVLFDNVLLARAPDLADASTKGLSSPAVEKQLRFWADALRSVAPEFLRGDDAALADGERVIRQSVADEPQVLTIWLPADATPEDEERAVERARRTTPPEVRISMRKYAR